MLVGWEVGCSHFSLDYQVKFCLIGKPHILPAFGHPVFESLLGWLFMLRSETSSQDEILVFHSVKLPLPSSFDSQKHLSSKSRCCNWSLSLHGCSSLHDLHGRYLHTYAKGAGSTGKATRRRGQQCNCFHRSLDKPISKLLMAGRSPRSLCSASLGDRGRSGQ